MYLVISTRPDLAFTVSALSQFLLEAYYSTYGYTYTGFSIFKGTRNLTDIQKTTKWKCDTYYQTIPTLTTKETEILGNQLQETSSR